MSRVYPQPQTKPWFPNSIDVVTVTARDLYGEPTATTSNSFACKVVERDITVGKGGDRSTEKGIVVTLPSIEGLAIGYQLYYESVYYTVITVRPGRRDHRNLTHYWVVEAVERRG